MKEGHKSIFNLHSNMIKIYQDLKKCFWCSKMRMTTDVAYFLASYLTSHKIKMKNHRSEDIL